MRDGGDKEVQSFIGRMMTKGRGLVMAHGWNDWPQALTKLSYLVSSLVTSYHRMLEEGYQRRLLKRWTLSLQMALCNP